MKNQPQVGNRRSSQRQSLIFIFVVSGALLVQGAGTAQAADELRITDDPQGRARVPLAESGLPVRNDAAMYGGVFDPEESRNAAAREMLKQTEAIGSPLVIPAAGFTPDGANPESMYFPFTGGYFQGDADNYGCMVAPAYLPAGAVVTDLFATVYDDDGTYNITINMRRVDNFAGGTDTMANAVSAGTFAGITTVNDASIDFPEIVYPDYSYYVTACVLSSTIRLYSVRVYYQ